jgi:hypothetical protein
VTKYPLISIVIPTYKRIDKLIRLVKSINQSNYSKDKLEIIIVDDASKQDYSKLQKEFPKIKLIQHENEKWLAETRNSGIRISSGEYIFLVDDDNVIDKNCVSILAEYLNLNPSVGIVAPVMYYYKQKDLIWCAGIKRNYYTSLTTFINRGKTGDEKLVPIIESEDFPNAFLIRRKVINHIGFFDSNHFPIHYDEADFCRRARNAGYEIYCVTKAKIWHDIVPTKESIRGFHLQSKRRAYFSSRNRILFHRIYNKNIELTVLYLIFLPLITFFYVFTILVSNDTNKFSIAHAYLKGTYDGMIKEKLK